MNDRQLERKAEIAEVLLDAARQLGETRLIASTDALTIDLTAEDPANLSGLRDVVVRHVDRFAFRETLRYAWSEAAPSARDVKEPSR